MMIEEYTVERVLAVRRFREGYRHGVAGKRRHTLLPAADQAHWNAGYQAGLAAMTQAEQDYMARLVGEARPR